MREYGKSNSDTIYKHTRHDNALLLLQPAPNIWTFIKFSVLLSVSIYRGLTPLTSSLTDQLRREFWVIFGRTI